MKQLTKVVLFLERKQKKIPVNTELFNAYRTVILDLCAEGLAIAQLQQA